MTQTEGRGARLSTAEQEALAHRDQVELGMLIARRHYLGEQSKVEIAREFGLSRFQVARLLAEAHRNGTVRIEIGLPGREDDELGLELAAALGLPRALVTRTPRGSGNSSTLRMIGGTLARVLGETVHEGDVLGLAWSWAIESMARQVESLRPCTVVQLAGAVHVTGDRLGSVEVIRRLADVAGGTARPIYAPFVVEDEVAAESLRQQPEIATTARLFDALDVAVVSIGTWRPSGSAVYDAVSEGARAEAVRRGVCGEVGGRLVGHDGRDLTTSIDARMVGITAEQLRRVPHTIATSYGAYRAEATVGAVRAGLVTTLIADEDLARAILAGEARRPAT